MNIRTFEAFSMKDAVKALKKDLGPEAVILSTKEKPSPTGRGMVYEVTAAASQAIKNTSLISKNEFNGEEIKSQIAQINANISVLADFLSSNRQLSVTESGIREIKLLLLETLRKKDGSLLKDLREDLVPVERQLRVMGIDDIYCVECLKFLQSQPSFNKDVEKIEKNETYTRDLAIKWMMKKVKISPRWQASVGSKSMQIIIGPSGVGKSSLVSKLAAYFHKKEKLRVCIVSIDQNRIAATEQMRVISKIIGIPFFPASNQLELLSIFEEDIADLIFVDTPGISPKDQESIGALSQYKSSELPSQFHLCLSMTEKEPFLDYTIRSFSRLGISSLSFTKMDEAISFGELFNLTRRWSLPLAYFSNGSNISDNFERASRERVVERIFGI